MDPVPEETPWTFGADPDKGTDPGSFSLGHFSNVFVYFLLHKAWILIKMLMFLGGLYRELKLWSSSYEWFQLRLIQSYEDWYWISLDWIKTDCWAFADVCALLSAILVWASNQPVLVCENKVSVMTSSPKQEETHKFEVSGNVIRETQIAEYLEKISKPQLKPETKRIWVYNLQHFHSDVLATYIKPT